MEGWPAHRDSILLTDGAKALSRLGRAAMRESRLSFCGIRHHGGTHGPYNESKQLLCTVCEGIIEVGWPSDDTS